MIKSVKSDISILGNVNLVVFDLDGVLIDTSRSFPMAVYHGIVHYLKNIVNLTGDLNIAEHYPSYFKKIEGFNNDWILGEVLFSYTYLSLKMFNFPDIKVFTEEISSSGPGLNGFNLWLKSSIPQSVIGELKRAYKREVLWRLFQEFYAGVNYCKRIYGFEPEYVNKTGTCEMEFSLVNIDLLRMMSTPFGIFTGRNREEFKLAMEKIGYSEWNEDHVEIHDNLLPDKPHPSKLKALCERAGASKLLFVGDTYDDFLTVQNFNELGIYHAYFTQISEDPPFSEVDFWASNVNDLLLTIIKIN